MTQTYLVANNAFSLTLPTDLPAWISTLRQRFAPFAAERGEGNASHILHVEVVLATGPIAECGGEEVYEPDHAGIGFITSRVVSRSATGEVSIYFKHPAEAGARLCLNLSPEFDRAEILFAPANDDCDPYFLTHSLMIAYMLAALATGTLMFHSSAVIHGGRAYLFQGRSGTGKSTHSRMWLENVDGTELLNDDNPLVALSPAGTAIAYGSPWSGKTNCYRAVTAPVAAFVRIVRAERNHLVPLSPLRAYASLTASALSAPFLPATLRTLRHRTLERLVATTPVCEMHCLPNPDAAHTCLAALS